MIRVGLDDIIRDFLNEMEENSPHQYARLVRIAKSGLRELNLDIASTTKVVELDIDTNTLSAPLPNDYITYKRIGMCIKGKIVPLGYNPSLCINRSFSDCGDVAPTSNTTSGIVALTSSLHYRNGESLGAYFGVGGGNNALGYYRIVEEYGEIHFGSLTSGTVILEYLSDIDKQGSDYAIHPYLVEVVKAWLGWATIRNKKGVPQGELQQKRFEYYNQRRLAGQRYTSFTLDEAYQYSRLAFKQSPKI